MAGFAFEAHRNAGRLERAFAQATVGALSGAVGTYSATSPEFEQRVLDRLGLERESVSTQVVARDRHAELLQAIALAGAGMERFATEVRHLARTEVGEVREPFGAGQKGSSSMPHKRNPIKSEQIAGLARVLRGNALAALEDVALWHERDISHSSVERIILPDSTTLLDHLQRRTLALVDGMVVDAARMRSNLELTCGALFSQRLLLALVQERGLARDDAYRVVQRLAQRAVDERVPLRELAAADAAGSELDLEAIFDYAPFVRYADQIVGRLDAIA
jgi:adenylosuccinate lyase